MTMEYLNQYHKEATEKCFKELEEQKKLKLNSQEEAKKLFEMHARIATNYPKGEVSNLIDDRELIPEYIRHEQPSKD